MGRTELDTYALTGRFLMGRLREAMTEDEKRAIEGLIGQVEEVEGSTVLLGRGQLGDRSTFLLEGMALRTITKGERRFVVGMHVPGDFTDLHCFALKRLDHDIVTVGPVRVGYVPHARIEDLMERQPHLARILWFSTLLDAAIHREWILKLEQLTAARRVAHVFAELWHRLDLVGLGRRDGLRTPLTQSDLADMCGTTAIHMNRALAQLKKAGVAEFRRGTLYVDDRRALEAFGEFDPAYLYGEGDLRVRGELDKRPNRPA